MKFDRLKDFWRVSKFNPYKWLWCLWCELKFQIRKRRKR